MECTRCGPGQHGLTADSLAVLIVGRLGQQSFELSVFRSQSYQVLGI